MKRVLLAALLATLPLIAHAESLETIFRDANAAFARGEYADAEQRYRTLLDAGIRDADVYMNLGLAYARGGELGRAVLAFEQSLRLRPGDAEANQALALARAAIGKQRAERHGEAVVETRPPLAEALVRPYSENTLAVLALLFDVVLFGSLLARRRTRTEATRTGFAVAAALAGLASVIVLSGLFIKRGGMSEGKPAIVLRDGAELREAPDRRALARAHAQEGGSARVIGRDGSFVQVKTATGSVGWMAKDDIGVVAD
jgi:tetratricopeptide (TPR) repeat protein